MNVNTSQKITSWLLSSPTTCLCKVGWLYKDTTTWTSLLPFMWTPTFKNVHVNVLQIQNLNKIEQVRIYLKNCIKCTAFYFTF